MTDQIITFDTAKLAKEKGFDWECNVMDGELPQHHLYSEYIFGSSYEEVLESGLQKALEIV